MEPFVHALIPLAFLLALFPNLPKKYLFSLVPIVWIIDLDTFIGIHRFTFHNIFFVLLLACIAYYLWKNKTAFWIAFYYGFSHLLLDFAMPGPAWFYPFIEKTFYFDAGIERSTEWIIHFSTGSLSIEEFNTLLQTISTQTYVGESSILFILLFSIVVVAYKKGEILEITRKWMKKKEKN